MQAGVRSLRAILLHHRVADIYILYTEFVLTILSCDGKNLDFKVEFYGKRLRALEIRILNWIDIN